LLWNVLPFELSGVAVADEEVSGVAVADDVVLGVALGVVPGAWAITMAAPMTPATMTAPATAIHALVRRFNRFSFSIFSTMMRADCCLCLFKAS